MIVELIQSKNVILRFDGRGVSSDKGGAALEFEVGIIAKEFAVLL